VPRVVATRPLLPRVEKALRESFAFESLRALDHSALAGAEGLVTVPGDTVDAALLDAAGPQLRVVAQHAVGFDNVDLEAATERGVVVTNTPDVLTAATAEFTLALLLALVRRVAEGDRLVRAGGPWSWEPTAMLGTGLAGKTLGLVGRGRIGGEVARLAGAFGMWVVHTSRSGGLPLAQLLSEADVVSLHVPLTAETRHLIDAAALERMGPQALLVNTTRGPVVDESALADALEAGTIAGAALDVFEREPEVEPRLLSLPNVVLTPHVASATVEAREAMGMLCVDALRAVLLEGRAPENALNPEALS
jgi:glyoxylate reductase